MLNALYNKCFWLLGRTRPSAYSTVNSKTPDRKGRPIARPATSQRKCFKYSVQQYWLGFFK